MQPFSGPRRKLKRAADHLNELHRVIDDFLAGKPYTIPYYLNPQNSLYECRLEYSQRPPELDIGILLGEFAYQLRSALDHVIFELSLRKISQIANTAKRTAAEGQTQFPIFVKEHAKKFRQYLEFVDEPIWNLVEVYQPYSSFAAGML